MRRAPNWLGDCLGVAALLTVVLTASSSPGGQKPAAEGVEQLDQAWAAAAKAGDVEALVALYAPDAVLYTPDMMEARGTAAIRQHYTDMMRMVTVQDMKISNPTSHTSGDVSVGWMRWTLIVVPKDSAGSPMTLEGRATAVARRINGKWLYVNDHASLPLPSPPPPSK